MMAHQKLLAFGAIASILLGLACAVPIAPNKSWCKISNPQKNYALFPSGKCALCEIGVYGPNHCNEWIGELCQQGAPYAVVQKNGFRYCVCNGGWYGSPRGDKLGPEVKFTGPKEAGCSVCPVFATTSKKGSTKASQCNICRGDLQYEGSAPFCVWTPTKFALPDCSIPKPWETYGMKLPGNGGCGCKVGTFGHWPDCRPCEPGLTAPAGNDGVCTCDPSQGFLPPKGASKACTCNTAKGYYPALRNATDCVVCSKVPGSKVAGGKCGCDASKGFGANLGVRGPQCLKCSDAGAVLDAKTGQCRCRAGSGVEIHYDPTNADTNRYCKPCSGKGFQVDSKGVCTCAKGYAWNRYVSGRTCIPCAGGNKRPIPSSDYPLPICGCKPGFEGAIYTAKDTCKSCGPGRTADATKTGPSGYPDEFCRCTDRNAEYDSGSGCSKCADGYVRDSSTKKCVMGEACKLSVWTLRVWGEAALGGWNGTFFPNQVLSSNTPPTKTMSLNSQNINLGPADIPSGSGKFAAVLDIVLWGKKGAPYWLAKGQGRYPPASRLVVAASASKTLAMYGADAIPNYYAGNQYYQTLNAVSYGDACKTIRVFWWGVKGKAVAIKGQILRTQGQLGWY